MNIAAHRKAFVLVNPLRFDRAEEEHSGGLGKAVRSQLGQGLRSTYDGLVDAPLPERFRELLAALDEQGR